MSNFNKITKVDKLQKIGGNPKSFLIQANPPL
jgi:hypothetical protein